MNKSLIFFATLLIVSLHLEAATISYPSSCTDLASLGHHYNGFYTIWNNNTNSTANIYCDFKLWTGVPVTDGGSPAKAGIFFHAVKQTTFSGRATITFEVVRTNVGNAFNGSTGIFTAPVNGYYSFTFNGMKDSASATAWVSLFVNNVTMADAYYGGPVGGNVGVGLSGINTILQLSAGDQVNLFNKDGTTLYSDANSRYTQFSGRLVQ